MGLCILLPSMTVFSAPFVGSEADEYETLRNRMVRAQIESRGIHSPAVLKAMQKVKRHLFVPPDYRSKAYEDYPLPIGEGQTISQPYIVALMTQVLNLGPRDRVLEIGTGSGYQAAVLAEICDQVFSIEIFEILGKRADALMKKMGYANIHVKIGDGYQGWPEQAPFDAIIVTCAPSHIPQPLQDQLAEGGRMVIPVGEIGDQELILLTKEKGEIRRKEIVPVRFVPMIRGNGDSY
ncbi:MAG: protein-L-isoaspartate(D-aspartate) O-methyltransferase [Thermodesulfobacteriota bacterium]